MTSQYDKDSLAEWLDQFDEPLFISAVAQFVWQSVRESCFILEEHKLTQWLVGKGLFEGLDAYPMMLGFFAKHFLVRRSLYRLREEVRQKGFSIRFDLMRFTLTSMSPSSDDAPLGAYSGQEVVDQEYSLIAEFYGDLDTLYCASPDSVSRLISDFWRRYEAHQRTSTQSDISNHSGHHGDGGYKILGVAPDASWDDIKLAYRRRAAQEHPDKGGRAEDFLAIQQAYEDLRLLYKRPPKM